MKNLVIVAFLLGLSACGKSETNTFSDLIPGGNGTINSTTLTYELTENGCKTGSHSFGTKKEYCNGLESSSLNNGCAYDLRVNLYNQSCTGFGAFVETN